MNLRLHSKRSLILGLAAALAALSFWVPTREPSRTSESITRASTPADRVSPAEEESALIDGRWPFPPTRHIASI